MIYTVDEVSDLLDIPRPTLYRYLREYSIPHVRRSGKISIPEESFDRIKEARELHREGLGTASVRRRLREGNDPVDAEELMERLDRLSETWRVCGGARTRKRCVVFLPGDPAKCPGKAGSADLRGLQPDQESGGPSLCERPTKNSPPRRSESL